MPPSSWAIVAIVEGTIWITDLNDGSGAWVTNDAERVCRQLHLEWPRYRIMYRLHDNANKEWIPQSEIVLRRDLTYDDQAVLAKENEMNLLFQAMKDDAVKQMMRRLARAEPPAATPPPS